MLSSWRTYMSRIDELELRQRGMLLAAVIIVLYALWDSLLMGPLDARGSSLAKQMGRLKVEIATLNQEVEDLVRVRTRDPDAASRARLAVLKGETGSVDRQLAQLTGRLVPPRRMAGLLQSVLTREGMPRVLSLEGLGAVSVLPEVAGAGSGGAVSAEPSPGLYRHGLRAVFQGSYLGTLDYLRALEALPSYLIWQGVSIEVGRHPQARVTLEVYTLSLEDAWLGV